jgi:hypothetical protein
MLHRINNVRKGWHLVFSDRGSPITLKEYARQSLRELEVHDICCAWQKSLKVEFKPLMEELMEDSFVKFPSPSSSNDENSPSHLNFLKKIINI